MHAEKKKMKASEMAANYLDQGSPLTLGMLSWDGLSLQLDG